MKIYQLGASGHYSINHARYTAFSSEAYTTPEAAREAMPAFFKKLTTPKTKDDTMAMEKKGLRLFVNPLELVNNKKEQ